MKKLFLSAALLLSLCGNVHAQLAYGFEGGVGSSTMYFAPAVGFTNSSQSPILSWKFGQVADIELNNHIFVQTGANISMKGQQRSFSFYTSDTLNASVNQTLKLLYADIPLNIEFKTGRPGTERFFFGLGADFSYLIGGSNKYSKIGKLGDSTFSISATDRAQGDDPIRAFELGLNINAGYELPKGLFFRVYYTLGITDVGLGSEIDKNRMGGFAIGYLFGKAKIVRHMSEELIDNSADDGTD